MSATPPGEKGTSAIKSAPVVANRKGFYFEVTAGRRYLWCSCGRSKSQPFCDGSHAGTGFLPVAFKAERNEEVIFCGCKHTRTGPFCDGTHSNLPGGYRDDDPDSSGKSASSAGRGGSRTDGAAGRRLLFVRDRPRAAHRARHLAPLRRGESLAGRPVSVAVLRRGGARQLAGDLPPTGGIPCCS